MNTSSRKIVLGIGNILNRDEGLGVHALKAFEAWLQSNPAICPSVELLDGGTLGLSLLPLVEESSHLLILDSVSAGKKPGEIIERSNEQILLYSNIKMSQHQVSFQEVLGLAKVRGNFPDYLHLIGVQPADLSIGFGPSPIVAEQFPQVVDRIITVLQEWGELSIPVREERGT